MEKEQFEQIMAVLTEIKELLKEDKQPQTKITVVGNKPQANIPKGLNAKEDFSL